MASRLASGHIEAERRLRVLTEAQVARIWRSLPAYNRENVDEWLSKVIPVVEAAKRQSVVLTDGYLARALERRALGLDTQAIADEVRPGVEVAAVYQRPFVTLWSALSEGVPFERASEAGLARATGTAAMDVQMSMRQAANAVQQADDAIYGFARVADPGACEFCSMIDGAYVKSADAFPLHNNCGCGLEPLTAPHPLAATLPDGVAVHSHSELGPVLADPAHSFAQL